MLGGRAVPDLATATPMALLLDLALLVKDPSKLLIPDVLKRHGAMQRSRHSSVLGKVLFTSFKYTSKCQSSSGI